MTKKGGRRISGSSEFEGRPVRILPLMGSHFANAKNLRQITDPDERFLLYRNADKYLDYDDLTLAAMLGDRPRVEHLVGSGAKIEGSPKSGTTPLLKSLGGGHTDIARFLLHNGADAKVATESGWTPLHFASSQGFKTLLTELLNGGAEVNAKTKDDLTPLMLAARRSNCAIVKILLKHNADVFSRDGKGRTALNHAAMGDQDESGGDFRCVEALVLQGSDINNQSGDGFTALMGASFYGDIQSVKLLLARDAKLDLRNAQRRTALGLAELGKQTKVAQLLRSAGATE